LSRWGHMAVRAALRKERFPERFIDSKLLFQVSSFSNTKKNQHESYLRQLQVSFSFGTVELEHGGRGGGAGTGGATGAGMGADGVGGVSAGGGGPLGDGEMQLLWPTKEEVRTSSEGWHAGAALPADYKNVTWPHLDGELIPEYPYTKLWTNYPYLQPATYTLNPKLKS